MFSISEYIVRGSTGRSWYKLPHTLTEKSADHKYFGKSNTMNNLSLKWNKQLYGNY